MVGIAPEDEKEIGKRRAYDTTISTIPTATNNIYRPAAR